MNSDFAGLTCKAVRKFSGSPESIRNALYRSPQQAAATANDQLNIGQIQ